MGRARNVGVWTQRIAIAAVVALVVGFAVRVGSSSSQSLDFRDPLIWLANEATGEVIQADSGSGDITARVAVGSAGDALQVVQHDADAIVLNGTTGEVLRVNGSLLGTAERAPVDGAGNATLLGRGDEVRIVSPGSVTTVDPRNAALGVPVPVPVLTSPVLDDEGAVWGLDAQRHVFVVTDTVGQLTVPEQTRPYALVDAGGSAQLLDGSGPTLRTLESADSGLGGASCVGGDLTAGVAVGGSVDAGRTVVMVDPSTATVRMSDLLSGRCSSATIENAAGARFGASVESGGLAFVPILSTGEVVVVRVDEGTVLRRVLLTGVDRPFELTVKDGTVWYNEPGGPSAGVLGAEGVLESIDKYQQLEVSGSTEGSGEPDDEQPDPGANNTGDGGAAVGTQPEPGSGQPGTQPAGGNSDAGGAENQSVNSNGSAEGPVEDGDLDGLVADFTFSKRLVEVGEEVTFVDRSLGGPVAWTWEFGDGSFATGPQAAHSWDAVGAYRVTLRIEGEVGTAAATATIEVVDEDTRTRPNADFRYSASRVEVGQDVTFTDRSTGNPSALTWDFGDGGTGVGPTVRHAWTSAGTYQVVLTARNALGSDTSVPATITVFDRVEQPVAAIQATTTDASVNETVHFTSTSTGNPTEIQWSFDDGTSARGEQVSHAWNAAGTYDVTLRVSNSAGSDEATVRVVVDQRAVAPEARAIASVSSAEEGQEVRFTSLSTNNPTRLTWNFDDGSPGASGASVTHTFTRAGRYDVSLRAENDAGWDDVVVTVVVVADVPAPDAVIGIPNGTLTAGVPIQFTDQSTGGPATSWRWEFDDGKPASTMQNPTHVFDEEGTYMVRLHVENRGGQDDDVRRIEVRPPAPVVDFTWAPTTPNVGQEVRFTDASRNVTPATTWRWDFGDGSTSTDRNPVHVFADSKGYTVKVTVTNGAGPAEGTKTVNVNPRPPVSRFTYAPGSGITTATDVRFGYVPSANAGEPETFRWNFGDGTPESTERNPVHRFPRGSTGAGFPVTLTVGNAANRSVSSTQSVRVTVQPPTPAFSIAPTPRLVGTPIAITNTTPAVAGTTFSWSFGDGTSSSAVTPNKTYNAARDFTVTLRATIDGVVSPPVSVPITIYGVPTATINAVPGPVVAGRAVTISAAVTNGDATWTFSNGTGPTAGASVSHTFTSPGTQRATVTVRNAGGGELTRFVDIPVQPAPPVSAFTMRGEPDGTVRFTYTATLGAGEPEKYFWDFGPGDPVEGGATATHQYSGDGPWTASLRVVNDTAEHVSQQNVPDIPDVDFDWSPLLVLPTTDVELRNRTQGSWANADVEWDFDEDGTVDATGNAPDPVRFAKDTRITMWVRHPFWGRLPRSEDLDVVLGGG